MGKLKKLFLIIASFAAVFAFAIIGVNSVPTSVVNIGGTLNYSSNFIFTIIDANTVSVKARVNTISGDIEIPSQVTISNHLYSVVTIDEEGFKNCSNITDLKVPSTITSIGSSAFDGCSNMENVTIDSSYVYNNLTSIDALGNLIASADTINLKTSADNGTNSFLNNNYIKSNVISGYNTYSFAYLITIPTGEGYELQNSNNTTFTTNKVRPGDSISFKVAIQTGYTDSTPVVKSNGTTLTPTSGLYTISNIQENKVLTVEGVEINKYTITFAVNNNTYGSTSRATQAEVPYGSTISVNGNTVTINGVTTTATPTAITGYTTAFSSWTNTTGTITTARTITANFTKTANTYTVRYNTWNGTLVDSSSHTYDTAKNLTTVAALNSAHSNVLNVTGYTFAGWDTTAHNTTKTGTVVHTDGKSVINLTATADGVVNLYATYTANEISLANQTYNLTYSLESQTQTIEGATNGTGSYTYAITAGNTSSYFSISGTTITVGAETPAGTYALTVQATDNDSAKQATATITFVVGIKYIEVLHQSNTLVYNGLQQFALFESPSVTEWWDYIERISGDSYGVNAGTYTVVFGLLDKTNTSWIVSGTPTIADQEVEWTIGKANLTLTIRVVDQTVPYTGSSVSVTNSFTKTATGLLDYDTVDEIIVSGTPVYTYTNKTGTSAYGPSTTAPTNSGQYSIALSGVTVSAQNYNITNTTFVNGTLTIERINQTITLSETSIDLFYGTESITFTAGTDGDGELSVSDNNATATSSIANGIVTVANISSLAADTTIIVTVTAAATENYNSATATCTINIISSLSFTGNNSYTFSIGDGSVAGGWDGTLEYKVNDGSWTTLNKSASGTISVSASPYKLYLRGTNNTVITGDSTTNYFKIAGSATSVDCTGNIMSLLDYTDPDSATMGDYCFNRLFQDCTKLTSAPLLPATTLASYCYSYMFQNCSSLTSAPVLPATTLTQSCYRSMFSGCTSLTTAPTLPATTLASSCYSNMFYGCTSLTSAPALPATTLASSCYNTMFRGCTSLTSAPTLPATTLASYCYSYMFQNCSSLTSAPVLAATTLTQSCYRSMFSGCTSLTTAPTLPATTLVSQCYEYMFSGCTSLTTAPTLPATTLASYCYADMFSGCTSLTTAPVLPATTLAMCCYMRMFKGCTSLTSAPSLPATTLASECYGYMFQNCTSLTTAPVLPATTLAGNCYSNMFNGCSNIKIIESETEISGYTLYLHHSSIASYATDMFTGCYSASGYFTGTPQDNNFYYIDEPFITFTGNNAFTFAIGNGNTQGGWDGTLEYKVNDGSWTTLDKSTPGTISVSASPYKLYLRGTNNTVITGNSTSNYFKITGSATSVDCTGNIMTLLNYANPDSATMSNYCFKYLFYNCTKLTSAPTLPATTLASSCYNSMFQGCTSLTTAPTLPATTLANYCYYYMFRGCTSLTTAPTLPATTLADACYSYMFSGCTSLTTAPALPATILTDHCYEYMFQGCTSLTSAPALPATTLTTWCYSSMFKGCTSLTSAPTLPATTLADACYVNMFSGCTSLTSAPALPATTLAEYCYEEMFSGCTSLTTAPALPATTLTSQCYYQMFYNCTSLTSAPALPATILAEFCYQGMFSGCTSLTTAPSLPATTLVNACYSGMFRSCTSLTSAPTLPATTLAGYCYYWMFSGCTSLTSAPSLPATTLAISCYSGMFNGCSSLKVIESETELTGYSLCLYRDNATDSYFTDMFTGCKSGYFTGTPQDNNFYYIDTPFITLTGNNAFTFKIGNGSVAGGWTSTLQYKVNDGSWTTLNKSTPGTINVTASPYKLYLRGTGNTVITGSSGSSKYFNIAGSATSVSCLGDIRNLLNYSNPSSTTMGNYCFAYLFCNCSKLTSAPSLPATTLAIRCYDDMFAGCINLTTAPALPATTLTNYCYFGMFGNCTSLATAPALPATTLTPYCYANMFYGCSNLTTAPALSATTLASSCYNQMFYNCTRLTSAPSLPATTLASSCYAGMFYGCTRLTTAPVLPATTLTNAEYCYSGMFYGCTRLTTAPALPATTLAGGCYESMFQGCSSLTTAPALPATTLAYHCYAYMFYECTGLTSAPLLPATTLTESCYQSMFYGCTGLTSAPALPATTLDLYCYDSMFSDCTSLTTAPALPAKSLYNAEYCYENMFSGCTSLTSAPALPATTLASSCYQSMFTGCTSLTSAPALPATTLAEDCYRHMFQDCTSLTSAPVLPATTLARYCYEQMFRGCSSLKIIQSDTELAGGNLLLGTPFFNIDAIRDNTHSMFADCYSGSGYFTGSPEFPYFYYLDGPFSGYTISYANSSVAKSNNDANFTNPLTNTGDGVVTYSSSNTSVATINSTTGEVHIVGLGTTTITATVTNTTNCVYSQNTATYTLYIIEPSLMFIGNDAFSLQVGNEYPASGGWNGTLQYKINDGGWTTWDKYDPDVINVMVAPYKLYLRGIGNTVITGNVEYYSAVEQPTFLLYGNATSIDCLGNIMTLLDYTDPSNAVMDDYCFDHLFQGSGLTTAPELPATTLAEGCYRGMFAGCARLTTAPVLPATTLADYCYNGMFYNCTNLMTVPALPATTLASDCYAGMFSGCSNVCIIDSPTPLDNAGILYLHSNNISAYSYSMFYGCYIGYTFQEDYQGTPQDGYYYYLRGGRIVGATISFTTTNVSKSPDDSDFTNPITNTGDGTVTYTSSDTSVATINSSTGLVHIVGLGTTTITATVANGVNCIYASNTASYTLTVEESVFTLTGNNSFTFAIGSGSTTGGWDGILEYKVNDGSWTTLNKSTPGTISVSASPYKLYLRGTNNTFITGNRTDKNFNIAGSATSVACTGNIMTLLNYANPDSATMSNYCFKYLFLGCTSLTTAPSLPATTLAGYCYEGMFYGCTSLTSAPSLPSTTLASYCYSNMFRGCTSLTSAPALPATTLATYCYSYMFQGCTSLTSAPALPATTLADHCYDRMFFDCTGLTSAPTLPATTLATYCYQYMFSGCTSLTTAPALPATTLANRCYQYMFQNCSNLKVKEYTSQQSSSSLTLCLYRNNTTNTYFTDMFTGCYSGSGYFTGRPVNGRYYYIEIS